MFAKVWSGMEISAFWQTHLPKLGCSEVRLRAIVTQHPRLCPKRGLPFVGNTFFPKLFHALQRVSPRWGQSRVLDQKFGPRFNMQTGEIECRK